MTLLGGSVTGCGAFGQRATPEGAAAGTGSAGRPAAAARPAEFTVAASGDLLPHDALIAQAAADARARAGRDRHAGPASGPASGPGSGSGQGSGPGSRHDSGHHRRAADRGRGSGHDFRPMLGRIRPLVAGSDLGICHVETPLGGRDGPYAGYPSFNSPPQLAEAIKAVGYDTCSTASNHALDQGAPGVHRTLTALDAAGLAHAGTAGSAEQARRPTILNVKGVRVGHLSYTYGTNGVPKPAGKPWMVNSPLNPVRIIHDAALARAAGAEAVIVSMHWGDEYQHKPNAQQRFLAHKILATPYVDLIIGHHAHVVQPFQQINGKWVAYGLGNQIANPAANSPSTHRGVIARFRFTRAGSERWHVTPSFVPTLVAGGPIRLLPLTRDQAAADAVSGTGADVPVVGGDERRAAIRETARVVRGLGHQIPIDGYARPAARTDERR